MDNDDKPVGQILGRRDALKLMGLTGAALLAACAPEITSLTQAVATATQAGAANGATTLLPACIVRPEMTEGPYFVDEMLDRSDIRTDPSNNTVKSGIPLYLNFLVSNVANNACAPLPGVMIDVWHTDALGVYSDVDDSNFGSTVGQKFLRGFQVTDENGLARFTTIYPGWYQGRAVHIHFKIRSYPASSSGFEFTSQLFFDDAISDSVFALSPYNEKQGTREIRNDNDGIFQESGGQTLLTLETVEEGYLANFDIGLDFS